MKINRKVNTIFKGKWKAPIKFWLVIIGICSYSIGHSQSQGIPSFTLKQAIEYALENSSNIRNANINIADADQQIIERRAFGLPQIYAGVDYQHFAQVPKTLVPAQFVDSNAMEGEFEELQFGTKNNLLGKLEATSLIFDGSYFTALKAAKVYKQYVKNELTQTQRDVRNAIMEAYLPALILEESKTTIEKNISNLQQLLFETKELYKAGFAEQLDVDRLELSIANLNTELSTLKRQKQLTYNVLKFQMNYPMSEPLTTTDDIDALLLPVAEEDLEGAVSYRDRPEYGVLEMAERLNELNVELQKNGYLPSLGAFGSYQHSIQGNSLFKNGNYIPSLVLGLQLNVPIFDGFEKKAKVARAKLDLEILNIQKSDFERAMDMEIANARNTYHQAKEKLANQEKNLQLAERIYNTTKIKYKEGVGSSLETFQAEQSLFQTQQNIIQAKFDLLKSKINLDKALGKK